MRAAQEAPVRVAAMTKAGTNDAPATKRRRDGPTIGIAGWSIPRAMAEHFDGQGAHLERYARVLDGTEINTSFYRPHRIATYARWAAETPPWFRFSVKLPRQATHVARLRDTESVLDRFVAEVAGLGGKLGVLLVQMPPSLAFEASLAATFFTALRDRHAGAVVCEPRHATWFSAEAERALIAHRIGRVAADPAGSEAAARPGGWLGAGAVRYFRWHGSPRAYWSAYGDDWLGSQVPLVAEAAAAAGVWCIFDNTASGAALDDALRFRAMLTTSSPTA